MEQQSGAIMGGNAKDIVNKLPMEQVLDMLKKSPLASTLKIENMSEQELRAKLISVIDSTKK